MGLFHHLLLILYRLIILLLIKLTLSLFFEQLFWTIKGFLSSFGDRHLYSTFFININNSLVGLLLCIALLRRNLPCFFFINIIYITLLHVYIFIIIMWFMAPLHPKKIFIRMSCIDVNSFCHCSSFLNRLFLCVLLCYRI